MEADNRTKYLPVYSIGLICCMVYFMISCSQADEIALYYKTGFIASPVSKSFDSFEYEASSHSVDTIIYVKAEDFQNYCNVLSSMQFTESKTGDIHDYHIDIEYEGKNIAVLQPVPDSKNAEITTYTKHGHYGRIRGIDLYNLLCSARYFDFFTKEELSEHPMVRTFKVPNNYDYFWNDDTDNIPLPVKSRYKVIIRSE